MWITKYVDTHPRAMKTNTVTVSMNLAEPGLLLIGQSEY